MLLFETLLEDVQTQCKNACPSRFQAPVSCSKNSNDARWRKWLIHRGRNLLQLTAPKSQTLQRNPGEWWQDVRCKLGQHKQRDTSKWLGWSTGTSVRHMDQKSPTMSPDGRHHRGWFRTIGLRFYGTSRKTRNSWPINQMDLGFFVCLFPLLKKICLCRSVLRV